jgi:hypothetical protein
MEHGNSALVVDQDSPSNDFNGDGRSDILWRDRFSGIVTDWLATETGGFANNHANLFMYVPRDWQIWGTGDFNGDGKHDILWRHTSGGVRDWLGADSGSFADNGQNVSMAMPCDWYVAATGDFSGDGKDDILWRNFSGTITNWLGNASGGFARNDAIFFEQVPVDWNIVGSADFNNDGNDDLLWRHTSGIVTDWLGSEGGNFTNNSANFYLDVMFDWLVQPNPSGAGEWDY